MLPIEVGRIILLRPWLFDQDITPHAQSNIFTFRSQDRKITVCPSPPQMTKDQVYMVVGQFSEKNHFCPKTYCAFHVGHLNFDDIIRLYAMGFDKCVQFTTYFWKTLWHLLGTHRRFTATYLKLCAKVFRDI